MPSLSTYRLSGVSLTLDVGYLLTATAPDLGCGVSALGLWLLQRHTATVIQVIQALWCSRGADRGRIRQG